MDFQYLTWFYQIQVGMAQVPAVTLLSGESPYESSPWVCACLPDWGLCLGMTFFWMIFSFSLSDMSFAQYMDFTRDYQVFSRYLREMEIQTALPNQFGMILAQRKTENSRMIDFSFFFFFHRPRFLVPNFVRSPLFPFQWAHKVPWILITDFVSFSCFPQGWEVWQTWRAHHAPRDPVLWEVQRHSWGELSGPGGCWLHEQS